MAINVVNACTSPGEWLAGWQGLVLIALIISYLLVSLYYMIGKIIGSSAVEAKAKNELYQTIMTTIIAAALVSLIPMLCAFDLQGAGISKSGNLFEIGSFYTEWVVHKNMAVLAQIIFWNHVMSIFTSVGFGMTVYGISISNSPMAGLGGLSNAVNIIMSSTMIAVLVSFAQFVLLKFVYAGMFNILLPVGIVCRAFPFTREFGGALIAIAIGFFVFYPMMLNVDYVIVGQPDRLSDAGVDLRSASWQSFAEDLAMLGTSMVAEVAAKALIGLGPLGDAASFLLWMVRAFRFVDRMAEIYVELVTGGVAMILISAFLLPAMNGIVLVSIVRDLSKILGTEVDISTLTRMV